MISIFANPSSHRFDQKKLDEAVQYFEIHGCKVTVHIPSSLPEFKEQLHTTKGKATGEDTAVIMGGDGTFHQVIQVLAGSGIPIGLLPCGTTNVLALDLELPEDILHCCEIILDGHSRELHLGKVRFEKEDRELYFHLACGIGLDARVCQSVDLQWKKWLGKGAYAASTVKKLLEENPRFDITTSAESHLASTIVIANCKHYAGNYVLCEDANPFAPVLPACSLGFKTSKDYLEFFIKLGQGKHSRMKEVSFLQEDEYQILREGIPVQLDGDYVGDTPASVKIASETISILCERAPEEES